MKKVKLGEIAEIRNGATPDTKNFDFWDGNISWITPNDLSNNNSKYISKGERSITEKGAKRISPKPLPQNTVLLSTRAPIGYLAIASNDLYTNQGFKNIVIKNANEFSANYIYYYLSSVREKLSYLGAGTTFKEISGNVIKQMTLFLPDYSTQQKIAAILSSLDDKIETNNKIASVLEKMMKEIYHYWFVQFDFPDKNGKPYQSSGGEMVYNQTLKRLIPKGWEVKTIGTVATLYQPKTISADELIFDGKYLVYGANGIVGNYDKYNHENNEIAICCRGASCGQYVMTQPCSWITGNAMIVTPNSNTITKEYLYYGLSIPVISKFITGSAQPQITRTNLELMKVVIPNNRLLCKFDMTAIKIREQLQNIFKQTQTLTALRDFLLPLLMNGQASVQ